MSTHAGFMQRLPYSFYKTCDTGSILRSQCYAVSSSGALRLNLELRKNDRLAPPGQARDDLHQSQADAGQGWLHSRRAMLTTGDAKKTSGSQPSLRRSTTETCNICSCAQGGRESSSSRCGSTLASRPRLTYAGGPTASTPPLTAPPI